MATEIASGSDKQAEQEQAISVPNSEPSLEASNEQSIPDLASNTDSTLGVPPDEHVLQQTLQAVSKAKETLKTAPKLEVRTNQKQVDLLRLIASAQVVYSISGLLLGAGFMLWGAVLAIGGLAGYFTWLTDSFGASSYVMNAVPGLILFVAGVFTIWTTRFSISTSRSN